MTPAAPVKKRDAVKKKEAPPLEQDAGKKKKNKTEVQEHQEMDDDDKGKEEAEPKVVQNPNDVLTKVACFPSDLDMDKCNDWVLLALITMKLCGRYPGWFPPESVENYAYYNAQASLLYYRHIYLRTQVAEAWQRVCDQSGNTDMSVIARLMPHCKLFIDPRLKVVAQDAVCVWSGEREKLHPVALVPITENNTLAFGSGPKQQGITAVQFHLGADFKDAFKVVHTMMFLLDYVPFQVEAGKKKAELLLKGEWCPEMERELKQGVFRDKSGPLYAIVKSVRDLIRANVSAFQSIVGKEIADEVFKPFAVKDGIALITARSKPGPTPQ